MRTEERVPSDYYLLLLEYKLYQSNIMYILCPITCGFAKVAIYDLFTGESLVVKSPDENNAQHMSRVRCYQFDSWHGRFNGYNDKFNVKYDSFIRYGEKIISNKQFWKKETR